MIDDALILRLSGEMRPWNRFSVQARMLAAAATGGALSLAAIAATLGVRSDLPNAVETFPFWMKEMYAIALGAAAAILLNELARPDGRPGRIPLVVPVVLLAGFAAIELATHPQSGWRSLLMGMSAGKCSLRIAFFAFPAFALLIGAFRGFAPVRLREAGAVIGIAAGCVGAFIYMLYCRETAAGFVLIWYTLGIAIMAAIGALLGPILLRWK